MAGKHYGIDDNEFQSDIKVGDFELHFRIDVHFLTKKDRNPRITAAMR